MSAKLVFSINEVSQLTGVPSHNEQVNLSATRDKDFIAVVSGLPRSGTSMMMQMLNAGNMPVLASDARKPDEDNPKGYYEFEKVKEMEEDPSWLLNAQGKAVKIVSPLLYHLDLGYEYRVIFLLRNVDEILASQGKMALRLNAVDNDIDDQILKHKYETHLEEIKKWLLQQKHIRVLYLNYTDVIYAPLSISERIRDFLGIELDVLKMADVVDNSLYRQREKRIKSPDAAVNSVKRPGGDEIIERMKQLGYLLPGDRAT